MKAMVLAAGHGTRLKPYTDHFPKPLFPVLGTPVLEWTLHRLRLAGVTEVVLNLHHLPAPIVRRLGSGGEIGLTITYSEEPFLLGTGGGLSAVRDFFADEECFLLHNGDVFTDWDLGALVRRHRRSGADATLALVDDPTRPEAQLVELDGERVVGIRGRPCNGSGPRFVFSGVSVLSGALFDHLPSGTVSCLVESGLLPLIESGGEVAGSVQGGRFCDIGTPERYLDLQWDLVDGMHGLCSDLGLALPLSGSADTCPGARLTSPVLLCPGSRIEAGATVGPRVLLCGGAVVEAGARVRDAVVFPDVVVTGSTEGIVL